MARQVLKSGRLVDHATLGARVASDDQRRVVVDDILDESDAFDTRSLDRLG